MPHAQLTCKFRICYKNSLAMDYQESDKQTTLKPSVTLFLRMERSLEALLCIFKAKSWPKHITNVYSLQ